MREVGVEVGRGGGKGNGCNVSVSLLKHLHGTKETSNILRVRLITWRIYVYVLSDALDVYKIIIIKTLHINSCQISLLTLKL